jgi:hypothetical protein
MNFLKFLALWMNVSHSCTFCLLHVRLTYTHTWDLLRACVWDRVRGLWRRKAVGSSFLSLPMVAE